MNNKQINYFNIIFVLSIVVTLSIVFLGTEKTFAKTSYTFYSLKKANTASITDALNLQTNNFFTISTTTSGVFKVNSTKTITPNKITPTEENTTNINHDITVEINKINAPIIYARNAVVYDVTNKEFLYSKNAEEKVGMASLVKIITAAVFVEINSLRTEIGNPIKTIKIVKRNDGYNKGDRDLVKGEEWGPANLIRYMLITSSNFAAESLARSIADDEVVFSILMNKTVKDMGFKSFSFKNSSGLSIPNPKYNKKNASSTKEISSAYGSAREMAIPFDDIFTKMPFIADNSTIQDATFINKSGTTYTVKNINQALDQIPNIIAGKTGTTDEAGGNLMFVVNIKGQKYVMVILGSTIDERYKDAMALASSTEMYVLGR